MYWLDQGVYNGRNPLSTCLYALDILPEHKIGSLFDGISPLEGRLCAPKGERKSKVSVNPALRALGERKFAPKDFEKFAVFLEDPENTFYPYQMGRKLLENLVVATGDALDAFRVGRYARGIDECSIPRTVFLWTGSPLIGFLKYAPKMNAAHNNLNDMSTHDGKFEAGRASVIVETNYNKEYKIGGRVRPSLLGDLLTLGVLVSAPEGFRRNGIGIKHLSAPFEIEAIFEPTGEKIRDILTRLDREIGINYSLENVLIDNDGRLTRYEISWAENEMGFVMKQLEKLSIFLERFTQRGRATKGLGNYQQGEREGSAILIEQKERLEIVEGEARKYLANLNESRTRTVKMITAFDEIRGLVRTKAHDEKGRLNDRIEPIILSMYKNSAALLLYANLGPSPEPEITATRLLKTIGDPSPQAEYAISNPQFLSFWSKLLEGALGRDLTLDDIVLNQFELMEALATQIRSGVTEMFEIMDLVEKGIKSEGTVNLNRVVTKIVDNLKAIPEYGAVQYSIAIPEEMAIEGSEMNLESALMTLIENGANWANKDQTGERQMDIVASDRGVLEMRNTGPYVEPEAIENLRCGIKFSTKTKDRGGVEGGNGAVDARRILLFMGAPIDYQAPERRRGLDVIIDFSKLIVK